MLNAYGNPKPAFRAFETLHEAGELAAPIMLTDGASAAAAAQRSPGKYATKPLGPGDSCAVTSFVTVQQNDLQTATVVKAFFAAYNTSSESGTDDRPMPTNLAITAEFCGLPPTAALSPARLRRIDTTHANPRGYWRSQQKRVTCECPQNFACMFTDGNHCPSGADLTVC